MLITGGRHPYLGKYKVRGRPAGFRLPVGNVPLSLRPSVCALPPSACAANTTLPLSDLFCFAQRCQFVRK